MRLNIGELTKLGAKFYEGNIVWEHELALLEEA